MLLKNAYPSDTIDKTLKTYLRKLHEERKPSENSKKTSFIKLPYIGKFSKFTQQKVNEICEKFCKNTDIQIAFSPTKISSFFSAKDKVPSILKSFVVYHFICANCEVGYVGETCRYLHERINEHLKQKSSHIFKHLSENPECKQLCDKSCFKIIDSDRSAFRLKVKEALHISWIKPELNKQVIHLALSISV